MDACSGERDVYDAARETFEARVTALEAAVNSVPDPNDPVSREQLAADIATAREELGEACAELETAWQNLHDCLASPGGGEPH